MKSSVSYCFQNPHDYFGSKRKSPNMDRGRNGTRRRLFCPLRNVPESKDEGRMFGQSLILGLAVQSTYDLGGRTTHGTTYGSISPPSAPCE